MSYIIGRVVIIGLLAFILIALLASACGDEVGDATGDIAFWDDDTSARERTVSAFRELGSNTNPTREQLVNALIDEGVDEDDAEDIADDYIAARNRGVSHDSIRAAIRKLDDDADKDDIQDELQVIGTQAQVPQTGTPPPGNTPPSGNVTPPAGNTPTTGSSGSGCTNSPNIPCVVAQGQQMGFDPFKVGDKVVGGPANQWWPLQDDRGDMVPNSYKMTGMRKNDPNLPGYELHVPAGMIMDVWLHNIGFTNFKNSVRVYGPADIKADYKVAEATLYAAPMDFVSSLSGQWARRSDGPNLCGDFSAVGTLPPEIVNAHDCHQATAAASGSANPSQGTTAMTIQQVTSLYPALAGRLSLVEDGKAIKLASGDCVPLDLPAGVKADIWDGAVLTQPVGPIHVPKACEGTFRIA